MMVVLVVGHSDKPTDPVWFHASVLRRSTGESMFVLVHGHNELLSAL